MECYTEIRDHPLEILQCLQELKNSEDDYYQIRAWRPTLAAERAAQLIYLVTLSFNGIYRVNLRGDFNVPYGYKTHLTPCEPDRILAVSEALSKTELRYGDFESSVADAQAGDLIYFDPPYTVMHNNNGFLKYNARIFSWEDQIRLCNLAMKLADKGCRVIVSNANHESLLELYSVFNTKFISRPSRIAASGEHRGSVIECIFYKGCDI